MTRTYVSHFDLCKGKSSGDLLIPHNKGQLRWALIFSLMSTWKICRTNRQRVVDAWRRHDTHVTSFNFRKFIGKYNWKMLAIVYIRLNVLITGSIIYIAWTEHTASYYPQHLVNWPYWLQSDVYNICCIFWDGSCFFKSHWANKCILQKKIDKSIIFLY